MEGKRDSRKTVAWIKVWVLETGYGEGWRGGVTGHGQAGGTWGKPGLSPCCLNPTLISRL